MGRVGLMCVGVQMGELVTEAQWYRLMTGKGEPLAHTLLGRPWLPGHTSLVKSCHQRTHGLGDCARCHVS